MHEEVIQQMENETSEEMPSGEVIEATAINSNTSDEEEENKEQQDKEQQDKEQQDNEQQGEEGSENIQNPPPAEEAAKEAAATKIQALMRGKLARKVVADMKTSNKTIAPAATHEMEANSNMNAFNEDVKYYMEDSYFNGDIVKNAIKHKITRDQLENYLSNKVDKKRMKTVLDHYDRAKKGNAAPEAAPAPQEEVDGDERLSLPQNLDDESWKEVYREIIQHQYNNDGVKTIIKNDKDLKSNLFTPDARASDKDNEQRKNLYITETTEKLNDYYNSQEKDKNAFKKWLEEKLTVPIDDTLQNKARKLRTIGRSKPIIGRSRPMGGGRKKTRRNQSRRNQNRKTQNRKTQNRRNQNRKTQNRRKQSRKNQNKRKQSRKRRN
jgi:hypothetical protein